jgi:hypothetical protein
MVLVSKDEVTLPCHIWQVVLRIFWGFTLTHIQKKHWRRSLTMLTAFTLITPLACASSAEIHVQRDELTDKGENNFDVSANLSKTSNKSELKGRSVFQALGEYSYGFADRWEAGVKIPIFHADGNWYGSGLIGELKYVAPHKDQGFYWGVEIEVGYTSPFNEKRQWELETVPIFGYLSDRWHFTANPGLSITSAGDERGIVTFEPSEKISYQLAPKSTIGLEYFAEMGSLKSVLPRNERNEVAYLVLDTKVSKSTIHVGLGHGMTVVSPRWVVKFSVDLEFD